MNDQVLAIVIAALVSAGANIIIKFLEKKQRKNPKQKQQLFLYHKNAKPKNFLTQSSIPNWVNILIQLLTLGIAVFAIFQK